MANPVVSANFTRLQLGETVALSSMFEYSDADGDPIFQVVVSDSTFGVGQFFINGVLQLEGVDLTIDAIDLPNTTYRAGFFVGGETFTVTASDGTGFSPVSTNTIRVGNTAPTVVALPSVVPIAGQISFLSMIRVSDLESDPIVEYRFRDNGAASSSGRFILDGEAFDANVWHTVTAQEAQRVRYEGGSVKNAESFSVTVDDGLRSAVSAGRVVTGNSRPVVTPADDVNVLENRRILVSDTVTVTDADNDQIIRYYVVDRRDNADSGYLELNGSRLASATFHSLTPTQFANLMYVGAPAGPKFENIGIQVLDNNSALSQTVDYQIRTTTPVVIEATNKTAVLTNEVVDATRLFNAYDPDDTTAPQDDEIKSYYFVDRRSNANGGYWQFKGERMPSAQWFFVAASELSQLQYVGATFGPDAEFIGIQALDDGGWSQPVDLAILTDARPTAVGIDASVLEAYSIDVAPLVSGSNSSGASAEAFRLTDIKTNANGGYFEFQGTRLPSGQFVEVTAAEIVDLKYVGGAYGPQSESIRLQSIVGGVLSDPTFFEISTLQNANAPVVTAFDVDSRVGSVIDFASMFSWTDADGVPPTTIKEVRIFDTGTTADSGYFSINGVRQNAGEWIPIDYDLITSGEVRYHVANRSDSELYRVTVDDGRFRSVLDTAEIEAVANPVLTALENDFSVDTIERIPIGNFITQTDSGPPLVEYQVYDENTDTRSGRIELDGVDLQQGIVHTLTAAQFDRLVFKGAEADFGRQIDGMLVRGTNSVGLSTEWTRFNVNTDPIGADSLTSGTQFLNFTGDEIMEITYTFIDSGNQDKSGTRAVPQRPLLPSYIPAGGTCDPFFAPESLATLAWNQPQREETRIMLEGIQQYANINFREVPYDGTASDAQITFGSWGAFDCPAGAAAYAYLPADGSGMGNLFGDIWFDWTQPGWDSTLFDPVTFEPLTVQGLGTAFNFTVIHEVGHALGFKHPFEGQPSLSIFNNFDYNTVMAYEHFNGNSTFDGPYPEQPSSLMLYDIQELQRLYGARESFNPENNHYRFNDAHQQAIYDTGGIDTLNLTRHTIATTVDLREGQRSTLEKQGTDIDGNPTFTAYENSVLIPYGVIIENARTGSGSDYVGGNETSNTLITNDGLDTLIGRGGNDVLRGGDGADTYIWNLGDGRDTIVDVDRNVNADVLTRERDRIELHVRTGDLDLLEDDMIFRRLGNTLRIDLTLNREEAQGSIVIQNFHELASQVETLALYGPPATTGGADQQVGDDIDLISIWTQAGTLGQRFQATNVDGDFGKIATPV
ncbi:M10 family metallopeptidase [Mariniblastus fucicola]|uniref:Serralysin C n=1 Tax=Mariniblastus fucicola TaxID=980251 RepID=A0A5B9PAY6_9BACT|nr:M10 family metallopeptidase [Mariniblastus fucicola]QEG23454.1 Serralysin C precursor [Mariniblastus fucicola]